MSVIALIDYGSGNIRSVEKALAHVAAQSPGAGRVVTTSDPNIVWKAERIVLPGQGAFGDCMSGLQARSGIVEALTEAVLHRGAPFLGICVGMQLLADAGLEFGETKGLGWIGGVCRPLAPRDPSTRIPHMGWNAAEIVRPHAVFDALSPQSYVYFMHSYVHAPSAARDIAATTDHGGPFASAVARDNIIGVQFHPEKSQVKGLGLLARFVDWRP